MAVFDSATINTQGAYVEMDGAKIAGANSFPGLMSGSAPDIDVTTLRSQGREYRVGFRDPGTVTIPITLQPQSPAEKALRDAADAGSQHQFTFRFGGTVDEDTGYAGNTALVVNADLGDYDVSGRNLTTEAQADTLPGMAVGDWLEVGGTDFQITAIAIATGGNAGKAVITLGGTTSIPSYTATTSVAKLLRPGVKIVITASVQTFSYDVNIDDVARGSLTLRLSGRPSFTVGNPDLS